MLSKKDISILTLCPACLALIALFGLSSFFNPVSKYMAELVETYDTENEWIWFHDLDGDGFSEKITFSSGTLKSSVLITKDGNIVDQWNFDESFIRRIPPVMGDYNQNGLSEIYVFLTKSDSLFLAWFEPFNPEFGIHYKFISTFGKHGGKSDINAHEIGFYDTNDNGYKELCFWVNAGFSLFPRKFFILDIKNDSLYASPESSVQFNFVKAYDLTENGKPEFFLDNLASGNIRDHTLPYTDRHCWVMVFDYKADFLFEPIKISNYPARLRVLPFQTSNFNYIVVFYYNSGLTENKCKIKLYSTSGELIRERSLENYKKSIHLRASLVNNKANKNSFFLIYGNGKIEEIDSNLITQATYRVPNVNNGLIVYNQGMTDIDGNGEKEFFFQSNNKLIITRIDFSHPAYFDTKGENIRFITTIKRKEAVHPEILLAGYNKSFIYSYVLNPFYSFRWAAYTGIYGLLFGVFFLAGKFYVKKKKNKLPKIENPSQEIILPEGVTLTQREYELLELLIAGKSSRQIAKEFHISKDTVNTHRRNILRKTGMKSTTELISYVYQQRK